MIDACKTCGEPAKYANQKFCVRCGDDTAPPREGLFPDRHPADVEAHPLLEGKDESAAIAQVVHQADQTATMVYWLSHVNNSVMAISRSVETIKWVVILFALLVVSMLGIELLALIMGVRR